jgi:hypothetical protein
MDGYGEGFNAFHRGVDRRNNPYAEGARAYYDWFKGWDAAARQSEY